MSQNFEQLKIAVIGLGYVGLPLAVEMSKKLPTIGFDISGERVRELRSGVDRTGEVTSAELSDARSLSYTCDADRLRDCNFYIVTVPTPIDRHNQPDLSPLISASLMIGDVLAPGDYVVFESTVYPGATEEVCVPRLESNSGLTYGVDFHVGYSPERINPGDKDRTIRKITKVVSGSSDDARTRIADVYRLVVDAGVYEASSIRVAEAAKVIENTQRDVNIALINELAMIFGRMGIDTAEVLEAAGTKWNFLPFEPGLVGGHCIGVDPYYLTHKATEIGCRPEMILAGRRINDGMSEYVVTTLIKAMLARKIQVVEARVLVLGLTFKENCPDIRNSKVFDVVSQLHGYGANVTIYDPWVSVDQLDQLAYTFVGAPPLDQNFDVVILAVKHRQFLEAGPDNYSNFVSDDTVLFDLKSCLPRSDVELRL